MYIRVGKTGSLGPWSRVIVYCSKLSFCQLMIPQWENHFGNRTACYNTLSMTPLQGPKDPVLPTLMYMEDECISSYKIKTNYDCRHSKVSIWTQYLSSMCVYVVSSY